MQLKDCYYKSSLLTDTLLTLLVLFIFASNIFAVEIDTKAGTTGAAFLKMGVGARPVGLGESFVAVADDVNALYWNPAGISLLKQSEVTFMHNVWLEKMSYEYLGFVYPLERSAIGISAGYLNIGELEGRDMNDNITSNFTAYDMFVGVTYSQRIEIENEDEGKLLIGITVKNIQEKIEGTNAIGFGADAGCLFLVDENWTIGAMLQNFGIGLKFIDERNNLPMNIKIGTAYKFLEDKDLLLSVDLNKPIDNKFRLNAGAEYKLYDKSLANGIIVFRGGYKYQLGGNDDIGGLSDLSAGIGFVYEEAIQLDYAFVPYGLLDFTHRISLTIRF
ncbi:MAG: PorV/PorQ family protein [Candidatus Firestonebacteria bacterium]